MSRYDGLIIPRSYSEYINKTDAATLLQALQLPGVMDNAPAANSNHPIKSSAINKLTEWWNLRVKAVTPTTITEETLINNRKLSDYRYINIEVGSSNINTRETILIPTSKITSVTNYNVILFTFISGNRAEVEITFLSDTAFKIKASRDGIYTGIYGLF